MCPLTLMFVAFLPHGYAQISNSAVNYFLYDDEKAKLILMSPHGNVPTEWNAGGNVKILIHGWNSKPERNEMQVLTDQHFLIIAQEYARFDPSLNIILVDWTYLADGVVQNYWNNAQNVKPAGEEIAKYLVRLRSNRAFSHWAQLHIVGHSLGAHVGGVIGYTIQRLTHGKKIARITGLDPAGPGFTEKHGRWPADMTRVLDYTDANFVDILHTNMGKPGVLSVLTGHLGSDLQAGHADFYPNGGETQLHQCGLKKDKKGCSHKKSNLFFALALKEPHRLRACPCSSYIDYRLGKCSCANAETIGELASTNAKGRYYIQYTDKKSLSKKYFT